MKLTTRDTQTQIKHMILSHYLDDWAGIIISGLAGIAANQRAKGRPFRSRFVYVDGYSSTGRFLGDTGDVLAKGPPSESIWGSPIIGVRALDKAREYAQEKRGFHIETGVVLFELEKKYFNELLTNLKLAGYEDRLIVNPTAINPMDGEIVVINSDFLNRLNEVVTYTKEPYTKSFYLLDPYGPTGIPYQSVRDVISQQSADVMINFPYQDLHKKQGILDSLNPSLVDLSLLGNYDNMFGSQEWRNLRHSLKSQGEEAFSQLESCLTQHYLERLMEADSELAVKYIRMEFPDRDKTMFYLYLTTHDPTGALTLNEVLAKAGLSQYRLKRELAIAKQQQEAKAIGQASLFDIGLEDPAQNMELPKIPSPNVTEIADDLYQLFKGQTLTLKQMYYSLVNSDYFVSQISKALSNLKKRGLIDYPSRLDLKSVISFR